MTEKLSELIGGLGGGASRTFSDNLTWSGSQTFTGAVDLSGGTITFGAGSIARSKLATETVFIDLEDKILGADGAALAASETAGDFFRQIGTNQLFIEGEASQNETEVSVGTFTFVLPENYVSGGAISLVATAKVAGSGTLGACTIDFELRKQTDTTGAIGSDLVTTSATAITGTGAAKSFTVTPTGLVAGDKLVGRMTTSVAETGNAATIAANIYKVGASIEVKG